MPFAIFPFHLCKVLRLPRKIISANLKIWCSKMQPFSGNQRPDLLTSLMNMSLVFSCAAPATRNASFQILFKCPTPAIVFGNATKPSRFAHFWQGGESLTHATQKPHLNFQKWSEHLFLHFDLEMCFAPQRRALFRHLNFQKCSEPGVFYVFWLRHVLRATAASTFSTCQLPKVVRMWGVFYILTSKCTSLQNGVHFFNIATSKSAPSMVRFVHFDSIRASRHNGVQLFISSRRLKTLEKHSVSRVFYLFVHLHLLSSHSFSCLILSLLLFSSLTLLTSALPSAHIVGNLTSKLPSVRTVVTETVQQIRLSTLSELQSQ